MKCASCQEMHHGLTGLAPYPTEAPDGPKYARTYFRWLCKECREKERTGASETLPEPTQSYHETEEDWL